MTQGIRTPVYGKAEFFNPGGSVKDRIGLPIIERAERDGTLKPGGTIVEGTSGNTGVGLAIAAALKGYRCIFTMPDKMSQEKVRLLKAFGAEVIITPTAVPPDHPDNYVHDGEADREGDAERDPREPVLQPRPTPRRTTRRRARSSGSRRKGGSRTSSPRAGTGGTITGVGRYLKEKNPKIQIVAGDPVGSILAEMWRTNGKGSRGRAVQGRGHRAGQDPGRRSTSSVIDEFETVSDTRRVRAWRAGSRARRGSSSAARRG